MALTTEARLKRIRAALDLAAAAATEGEADAALQKALQMMAAYGVDDAMLAATRPADDKLGQATYLPSAPFADAKGTALGWIAHGLGLRSVVHRRVMAHPRRATKTTTGYTVLGYESDLARFDLLWTSCLMQITTGITGVDTWGMPPGRQRAYRRNYILGFGLKVRDRLQAATRAARADTETRTGQSTDLVFVTRAERVAAFERELFGNIGAARAVCLTDSGGYRAGQEAGDRMDLGGARVTNGPRAALGGAR